MLSNSSSKYPSSNLTKTKWLGINFSNKAMTTSINTISNDINTQKSFLGLYNGTGNINSIVNESKSDSNYTRPKYIAFDTKTLINNSSMKFKILSYQKKELNNGSNFMNIGQNNMSGLRLNKSQSQPIMIKTKDERDEDEISQSVFNWNNTIIKDKPQRYNNLLNFDKYSKDENRDAANKRTLYTINTMKKKITFIKKIYDCMYSKIVWEKIQNDTRNKIKEMRKKKEVLVKNLKQGNKNTILLKPKPNARSNSVADKRLNSSMKSNENVNKSTIGDQSTKGEESWIWYHLPFINKKREAFRATKYPIKTNVGNKDVCYYRKHSDCMENSNSNLSLVNNSNTLETVLVTRWKV